MANNYMDLLLMDGKKSPHSTVNPNPSLPFGESQKGQWIGDEDWVTTAKERPKMGHRQNPFGALTADQGGQIQPWEWILKEGMNPADPKTWRTVRDAISKYRGGGGGAPGAWGGEGGIASPFDPRFYAIGDTINDYMDDAPAPMRNAYAKSRFTYDNGLREPFGGERSNWNRKEQSDEWQTVMDQTKKDYPLY
jgi:hypothetical protein